MTAFERLHRDHDSGEGPLRAVRRVIQRLLGVEREPVRVEAVGVEAPADRDHLNDIVLATGGEPIIPIRGLRGLEGLWTSREATGMKAVPHRRLALGGGVSA